MFFHREARDDVVRGADLLRWTRRRHGVISLVRYYLFSPHLHILLSSPLANPFFQVSLLSHVLLLWWTEGDESSHGGNRSGQLQAIVAPPQWAPAGAPRWSGKNGDGGRRSLAAGLGGAHLLALRWRGGSWRREDDVGRRRQGRIHLKVIYSPFVKITRRTHTFE